MGESPRGRMEGKRSVSPVIRAKRGCVERVSVDVSVDKLNALRVIGNKIRRCIFADRVTKGVSECVMGCVSEYEDLMMRMIAKNERLIGRIDECEKMTQLEMMSASASYAIVAGKSVCVGE